MRPQLSPTENTSRVSIVGTSPDSGLSELGGPPASVSYSGSCHETYSSAFNDDMALDSLLPQDTVPSYSSLSGYPIFFEQVMLPDVNVETLPQEAHQPRGVFDFMLDTDFGFAGNDLFGTDFIPDLDRILDNTAPFPEYENLQDPQPDHHESASRRAAAFERSFWYVLHQRRFLTGH